MGRRSLLCSLMQKKPHLSKTKNRFDEKCQRNRAYHMNRWDMYITDIVIVKTTLSLFTFYWTFTAFYRGRRNSPFFRLMSQISLANLYMMYLSIRTNNQELLFDLMNFSPIAPLKTKILKKINFHHF